MLNISNNPIKEFDFDRYRSGSVIFSISYFRQFNRFLFVVFCVLMVMLFLPWTQNIVGKGYVTTLQPDKRPQSIQSPIPGRIDAWFVREGELVEKGDTLLKISEVKSDYFDPNLVARNRQQLQAKQKSVEAYSAKVQALEAQISALQRERSLKINQTENKLIQVRLYVQNDSIKWEAAKTDKAIAQTRFERIQNLYTEGLKATREVEEKRLKLREA